MQTHWILLSAITGLASVGKSGVGRILSTQLVSSKIRIKNIQDGQSWVKYRFFTFYPKSCDTLFESSENLKTDASQQYLFMPKILEERM